MIHFDIANGADFPRTYLTAIGIVGAIVTFLALIVAAYGKVKKRPVLAKKGLDALWIGGVATTAAAVCLSVFIPFLGTNTEQSRALAQAARDHGVEPIGSKGEPLDRVSIGSKFTAKRDGVLTQCRFTGLTPDDGKPGEHTVDLFCGPDGSMRPVR